MAYKALYRTYRPSTFDDVAGQQHVVKTLKNALANNKIAHAYLFAGPRGTGKTSMAKLFAKALNCEEGIGCQCNKCKNCLSIINGSHPDVLELDAASNNGVDEIRDIIDKVKYGTILGRYKVYIIDEVHMLSAGAFNALLKTLEEPPEHVIFILATTEPHKILPTILSRCQRYDFTKVSDQDIKERLKVVLKEENVSYNDDAINLIISLCDGGMRDALSILDKVLAYSGNELSVQDILDIYALESKEEKINLLNSIINNDVKDVLDRLNKYIKKGTDINRLTNDLLVILKDVLIYSTSRNEDYLEVLHREEARSLNDLITSEKVMEMIEVLMGALKDYKNVTSINPLFEITLLKLSAMDYSNEYVPPKKEVAFIKQPKPEVLRPSEEKKEIVKPKIIVEEKEEDLPPIIEKVDTNNASYIYLDGSLKDDKFVIDDDKMIEVMVTAKKDIKADLCNKWVSLKKYTTHPDLSKFANLLIDCHVLVASNSMVVVSTQLPKIADKLNSKENQGGIQILLEKTFGKPYFLYAVNRNDSVRLQGLYMNKYQINTLPKVNDIKLEFKKGE